MRKALLVLAALMLSTPAAASHWALGYQKENWLGVDLDVSKNPKYPPTKEDGWNHLRFDIKDITTYTLEEPGLIFGVISGMADTEANRVAAKQQAEKDGSLTYSWNYGQPAPIPTGRWNRWAYATASGSGAFVEDPTTKAMVWDPAVKFDYMRINMDIVMAPELIGNSGFYWMPSFDFYGRSLKIYRTRAASDFSTLSVPLNLHLGWRPSFFPYLRVEGKAGWDFVSWGLIAIAAAASEDGELKNYTHGYNYGGKAALGVDWLEVYYQWSHTVEPLWGYGAYSRRYEGTTDAIGARFDILNFIFTFFVKE